MIKELFDLKPAIYNRADEVEMLPVLIKNNIKYILYGAGQGGELALSWVKRIYGIKPNFIVDKKPPVNNLDGVDVISTETFKKLGLNKFFVIVSILKYHNDKETRKEINRVIEEAGGNELTCIVYESYNFFQPYNLYWYHYVKEHISSFEKIYCLLYSSLSKETMIFYLRTIILGERYAGITFPEKYKYWGIDSNSERLFITLEEEVILNAGAARGDTVYQYIKCDNPYKKIIAVEASKNEYNKLKRNLGMLGKDILKKIEIDNIFLGKGENTIDNLYNDENISLINMDIEGDELSVLKSATNTIRNRRPVLSICVYHKIEDLIEIPNWINTNVENYIFELRKYPSSWYDHREQILQQNELVLYAIPRERYINSKANCC